MKTVTFITQVPVPEKDEEAFLYAFQGLRRILALRPGFVAARLLRGLTSSVAHTYVVTLDWTDSASLTAALASPEVREIRRVLPWKGDPAIYEPVE